MAERKFTKGLSKPGSAAQVRETVCQAVRESTVLSRPQPVEPLDYETFITKNRTILQNDPQREMLLFPLDDVTQAKDIRMYRTMAPAIPSEVEQTNASLFARECLRTYTADWHVVNYRYSSYSGNHLQLPKIPRPHKLEDQVYEVDAETEGKDSASIASSESGILKEGYVLKGPESGMDSFISIATKSFKRRYLTLSRQVDGSHILEFHKDDRKNESKGTICMDFCNSVTRNSKRGKLSFELQMSDGHKPCVLAVESESDLEEWIFLLRESISSSKKSSYNSSRKGSIHSNVSVESATPPASPSGYGTLRGLEHSKNPELVKYARETDYSITQARKENRQNVFSVYPEIQRGLGLTNSTDYENEIKPFKEELGTRIFLMCEEVKFRLQAPLESERSTLCQIEPYITTLAIYDAKRGRKVTEDFRFDVNHSYLRNMLPKLARKSSFGCGDASNELMHLKGLTDEWLAFPRQAIIAVQQSEPDLYIVVKIEKVLQGGIAQTTEPYLRLGSSSDGRLGVKVQKLVRSCCQRLGHHRMPFAWAARPLYKPFSGELDATLAISPIYRQEGNKLSDDDLLKYLAEFRKPDKLKHLTVIPGHLKVSVKLLEDKLVPNTLTSSLVPLHPFPVPPTHNPTLEIEKFPSGVAKDSHPFTVYRNLLYVFPKSLKFDGQKTFAKARNIACVVELRSGDEEDAKALKCIQGRPGEPLLITKACTAVTHHNTSPDFYEEVKLILPCRVHERHHLLFLFYHVSCEAPKGSKRRDQPVESVVGYSWLPLMSKGRLNIDEITLPVASNLPPGYLSHSSLGLGKGFSGPDIRWVDGGKELFKVELKLVSTVYTKDQHLNNFFVHCQKLLEKKITGSEIETNTLLKEDSNKDCLVGLEFSQYFKVQYGMAKTVQALHAVDTSTIINFLPTILNLLFRLLVAATSNEEVSLNTVRVLIHIVHSLHEVNKMDSLHCYIQYVFVTATDAKTTVHEELTKALTNMLRPANSDFLVINKFLQHSWFFFQLLSKSMAQHLLATDRIKMHRHERFPADYQYRVQTLLQTLVSHVVQKCKELPLETRKANQSMAHFLKKCLTFMDRGFVFRLINSYLEKFGPTDTRALQEYKFEFLEIICSHEHFVPLNLPLMRGAITRGHMRNIKESDDGEFIGFDFEQEYRLSEDFCRHHFLIGVLLQEVRSALAEFHDVRQHSVAVLRNLLAKHSFDDRYQGKSHQARVASLYLPFIYILLENINRLHAGVRLPSSTSPNVRKFNESTSTLTAEASVPSTPTSRRRTLVEGGTNSLPGFTKQGRDSAYLSAIAGQGILNHGAMTNGSCGSMDSNSQSSSQSERETPTRDLNSDSKGHVRSQSLPFSNSAMVRFDKLEPSEVKDLLVCFLYIIRHVNEELLIGWWQHCTESDTLDFFHLIELSLYMFRYTGKKHISNLRVRSGKNNQPKAMTLPARTAPPSFTQRCTSTYSETAAKNGPTTSEADVLFRALLEANMATEVGLIALDTLGLFCLQFKEQLLANDGDNPMMRRIFDIYLSFLQVGQSETLLRHLFASLRAFVSKFPVALFQGNALLCGKLCFELLHCCDSRLSTVRNEACALLYLLMRSNFEFTGRQGLTRVHLQLIVSVSRLLGEVMGLNNARFQESLSIICKYADSDKVMQRTAFPSEVKDLTKKIRTVLMATVQMKEHENDPEMLVDLQHSLANSYSATPALRKTWLESIARIHMKNNNFSEAAHCYLHLAALEAEFLKRKGIFVEGCKAFRHISPNIEQDESNLKDDSGIHDVQYTEDSLLERLEECIELLQQAERYEVIGDVYKLVLPIFERRRNFEALSNCYKTLHNAYNKIVEVTRTGRRLLGRYFRVIFYGQAFFEGDAGKAFVYKEPKVTSLAEISERMQNLFLDKFGQESVKMIKDSNEVDPQDLDPKYAYIQVTHVVPYFDERELVLRPTEFERNNNIKRFMFDTPFTTDKNRPHGTPDEQCKLRTILTTTYLFPYVKKRIPVVSKVVQQMRPIEVALDEMQIRVCEMQEVVSSLPTDLIKLQLKLQGSIQVQVNAGPLAYANAFLDDSKVHQFPAAKVTSLKLVFKKFVDVCQEALELNGKLIVSDQYEYHASLKKNYQELVLSLAGMLHEKFASDEKEQLVSKRTSLEVFNFISGSPGSTTV